MKRALLGTLWIGAVASGLAIVLQLSGLLVRPNAWVAHRLGLTLNESAGFGSLLFVLFLGFVVAWTILQVTEPWRRTAVLALLFAELIAATWILGRLGLPFPPLPALLAVALATILAVVVGLTRSARERRAIARLFAPHLGPKTLDRLTSDTPLDLSKPLLRKASFVFCEIGNEADLIDQLEPAACAELTRRFIDLASKHFLAAGGYLHGADGEGIRVLFGFPQTQEHHALEAARAALAFRDSFRDAASEKPDSLGKIDLRLGISSGNIVATLRDDVSSGEIVLAGEPLEIGRRLARANQTYGSQILLGPRTYNLAGKAILARPLDFLRSAEAHERFEVYELVALSEKATPEQIARRDQFWNGVLYFRARRWNEALAEFTRAASTNGETDRPLQWYLRRLEPVCLSMATEPAPVAEPLTPSR
jgi:class 3 adenylate cyclase